jgi:hypothetical protein
VNQTSALGPGANGFVVLCCAMGSMSSAFRQFPQSSLRPQKIAHHCQQSPCLPHHPSKTTPSSNQPRPSTFYRRMPVRIRLGLPIYHHSAHVAQQQRHGVESAASAGANPVVGTQSLQNLKPQTSKFPIPNSLFPIPPPGLKLRQRSNRLLSGRAGRKSLWAYPFLKPAVLSRLWQSLHHDSAPVVSHTRCGCTRPPCSSRCPSLPLPA